MVQFTNFSLSLNALLFAITALIIGIAGWKLSDVADRLADRTGLGEAIAGAILLGATTSLAGIITSVTTAYDGYPEMAISNAIGGIAAQTAFLAIADITYTRANLEHTAASVSNLVQGALLVVLLAIPLLAATGPEIHFWSIHPATLIMFLTYVYGMSVASNVRKEPSWEPEQTSDTQNDEADEAAQQENLVALALRFLLFGLIVGGSGWVLARSGVAISEQSGLSQTAVGGIFTAVSTSLPELVTSIAAVRQGAQMLAVSGIIGGNAFDTLFAAVADIAYRDGSIYHAMDGRQMFIITLSIIMTGVLLMGLIRRERRGIANIGFESFAILVLYVGAVLFMFLA